MDENQQNTEQEVKETDTAENKATEQAPKTESEGLKNLRAQYEKVSAELKKYKDNEATAAEKKLKEENKYKELLELKEKELGELKNTLTLKERTAAVEKALKKAGASEEAIDLLTDVIVSKHDWTDSDDASDIINKYKENKPSLFTTVTKGQLGVGSGSRGISNTEKLRESTDDNDLELLYKATKK
jgi:hypothetical protein